MRTHSADLATIHNRKAFPLPVSAVITRTLRLKTHPSLHHRIPGATSSVESTAGRQALTSVTVAPQQATRSAASHNPHQRLLLHQSSIFSSLRKISSNHKALACLVKPTRASKMAQTPSISLRLRRQRTISPHRILLRMTWIWRRRHQPTNSPTLLVALVK